MPSDNDETSSFSYQEENEWRKRHSKVKDVIKTLDDELVAYVNKLIVDILYDYFGDFPGVQKVLEGDHCPKETLPIIIFVTEDVLKDMGLFDEQY